MNSNRTKTMMNNNIIALIIVLFFCSCYNPELPEFIEIVNGEVKIINYQPNEELVVCSLIVKGIPEKLIFNDSSLNDPTLEYYWGVHFDNDRDGKDDVSFAISHWSGSEFTAKNVEGKILDYSQTNIWKLTSNGGENLDAEMYVSINSNKLEFRVPLEEVMELEDISKNSQVKFKTFYNDGNTIYIDSLMYEMN